MNARSLRAAYVGCTQAAYDVHPGVDALHSSCMTLIKFSVNEHVHSGRIFQGIFF